MSDYFGALMRSSGISVGGRAPETAQPRTVQPSVIEIDIEHGTPAPPPQALRTASTPHRAAAPIPMAPVDQSASPTPMASVAAVKEGPAVQARLTPTPQAQPGSADDTGAAKSHTVVETPKPALGDALVHAAMRWVAADPQQVGSAPPPARPQGPSSPATTRESSVIDTARVPRTMSIEPEVHPSIAIPARPITSSNHTVPTNAAAPVEVVAAAPIETHALASDSARPPLATPAVPVTPSARDELVEISIGAIHVRVDAPAAQTLARPPATPPAAAPRTAAASTSQRSALSRRALRRI